MLLLIIAILLLYYFLPRIREGMGAQKCFPGYQPINNHCYKFIKHEANYHDQQELCKKDDARLAVISDQSFISADDLNDMTLSAKTWIGLDKKTGVWKWSNGNKMGEYNNWDPDEGQGSNNACVYIKENSKWGIDSCHEKKSALCSHSLTKTAESPYTPTLTDESFGEILDEISHSDNIDTSSIKSVRNFNNRLLNERFNIKRNYNLRLQQEYEKREKLKEYLLEVLSNTIEGEKPDIENNSCFCKNVDRICDNFDNCPDDEPLNIKDEIWNIYETEIDGKRKKYFHNEETGETKWEHEISAELKTFLGGPVAISPTAIQTNHERLTSVKEGFQDKAKSTFIQRMKIVENDKNKILTKLYHQRKEIMDIYTQIIRKRIGPPKKVTITSIEDPNHFLGHHDSSLTLTSSEFDLSSI